MNNTAQWTVHPMLQKHKWEIDTWKYDGVYAFYNRMDPGVPIGDADAPVADSYAVLDETGALMGHFHFGADAHIPTVENYDYTPDHLDIGLGLRPDLCGHGAGAQFVAMGLAFAQKRYGAHRFRLSVAAFNERAIKTYEKVGFSKVCEVTNSYFKNKFYIMVKE